MYAKVLSRRRVCDFFVPIVALMLAAFAPSERRITLDLKDASLHNVIRLLADVGQVNIVVPDDVQGRVTIKLKNVPWTEALEVILRSKGLSQEKIGGVIQIDTLERSVKRQTFDLDLAKAKQSSARLRTVIIPLSYARATELAPLVRGMLTERGKLEVDARTNTLIITDVAENTDAIRARVSR